MRRGCSVVGGATGTEVDHEFWSAVLAGRFSACWKNRRGALRRVRLSQHCGHDEAWPAERHRVKIIF